MGTKDKIKTYVKKWENRCYTTGIPDAAPIELEQNDLVPSYRRICLAILKNDNNLLTLGFTKSKSKAYNDLKRVELIDRGVIKPDLQLKLKL